MSDNSSGVSQAPDPEQSAWLWHKVILEALRVAAPDYSSADNSVSRFFEALSEAVEYDGRRGAIDLGRASFHAQIEVPDDWTHPEHTLGAVANEALRYLAERGSVDPAAKGRASKRERYLQNAIEAMEDAKAERRARALGQR